MAKTGKRFAIGVVVATIQIVLRVVVPYYTLRIVRTITVEDISIEYTKTINDVTKWILRLGFVLAGVSFFKATSPKGSRRKAWFALFQTMVNVGYIYMFKFGGATELLLVFEGGTINLNVSTLAYLIMGQLMLSITLNVYQIIYNTKFYKDKGEEKFAISAKDAFVPEKLEEEGDRL
ncbi:MAG: hypothetical protein ACTSU5_14375 [Promethearchaeota archaeon]